MNKVYIAGKITGLRYIDALGKFMDAEKKLTAMGFEVVNPMNVVTDPKAEWKLAMRECIKSMMHECDTIFLLPDWFQSKGAQLEYEIANQLQFKLLTDEHLETIKITNSKDTAR